ncbi:MAG: hypothetical protein AAGE96_18460 [Cyanobacteria bacterium P01_G01_bin.19]
MTQPFYFPNGQSAYSAEDLLKLCQEFPDDGVNYLIREDLEKWLAYIGKEDIARCAANARQTSLEDRQKLEEFLTKCHALSSPESRDISKQTIQSESITPEAKIADVEAESIATSPVVKTSAVEPKPASTSSVSDNPDISVAEANSKQSMQSTSSTSTKTKPSFFKMIAKLIVNVIYRNKDKS